MASFAPHDALAAIWDFVAAANKYVITARPWELATRRDADPTAGRRGGEL